MGEEPKHSHVKHPNNPVVISQPWHPSPGVRSGVGWDIASGEIIDYCSTVSIQPPHWQFLGLDATPWGLVPVQTLSGASPFQEACFWTLHIVTRWRVFWMTSRLRPNLWQTAVPKDMLVMSSLHSKVHACELDWSKNPPWNPTCCWLPAVINGVYFHWDLNYWLNYILSCLWIPYKYIMETVVVAEYMWEVMHLQQPVQQIFELGFINNEITCGMMARWNTKYILFIWVVT